MAIKFDELLEALALDESLHLTESNWKYELKCGPALRKAIQDENHFEVMKQLRNAWQELFDNDKIDEWDYEHGIEDLEDLQFIADEDLEDELNYTLADFYDLCDNLGIWVPLLENVNSRLTEDITKDELFIKAYHARPELMDNILHDMGYSEDDYPTLDDVPAEDKQRAFSLWLDEVRERAEWQDDMDSAVYDIIEFVDSSNIDEALDESLNDMFIIIPTERRYDNLTSADYDEFINKYGMFNTRQECWDKIDELAPDRWDAFIPMRISGN